LSFAPANAGCIQIELATRLPDILGDHDELAQVFQNLVDNAIKYGRAGTGIAVTVDNVSRPCHDAATGFASFVSVSVRDQGEGITREHLPRLTERFYRVRHGPLTRDGRHRILNRHRGFLEIESTPGIGQVLPFSCERTRWFHREDCHRAAIKLS
jgi:two-component system phosphate regulon sensor histidine kinase PhoR